MAATETVSRLLDKIEGPLPSHEEKGNTIFRLELTRIERGELIDALYVALRRLDATETALPRNLGNNQQDQ